MSNKKGFTLIELLVVIAIISLLAAIAVPSLVTRIRRARMTKAEADIRQIETALGMLETEGGAPLSLLLNHAINYGGTTVFLVANATNHYLPSLLERAGVAASNYEETGAWTAVLSAILQDPMAFRLDPDDASNEYRIFKSGVHKNLSETYMEKGIPLDPWGNPYVIHVMPRSRGLREIRLAELGLQTLREIDLNGTPIALDPSEFPKNLTYYIYSRGENRLSDQAGGAGYDDINNWDTNRGWVELYR